MTRATYGPLSDVTVIAVEQAISAPICTRTLADLGARVIKIETPAGGDFTRHYDDVVNGMAAHFVWANRGKESVTLDLKSTAGVAALHRLLSRVDVLVSNLAPGAMKRLGLGQEALNAKYAHLTTLEIAGFGGDSPLAHKRAYDLLIQAESGTCATTGVPGQPAKSGPAVVDVCTGLYGAISILASLHERGRTGTGLSASVAMFDAATELMGYALTHARYSGSELPPVGMGSPALAPYGAYSTIDRQVVVLGTTNDAEWRRLASLMEQPELADDARFRHNTDRVARRREVDGIVAHWCATRTLEQIQQLADEFGIGNARYNTPLEVLTHPDLEARGRWRDVGSPVGPVTTLVPPMSFAGRMSEFGPVPGHGEHTTSILSEFGFSDDEITALTDGAIA